MHLRPYQEQALHAVRTAYRAGHARALVVMPTGTGKTVLFAEISRLLLDALTAGGATGDDPSAARGLIGCISVALRAQSAFAWKQGSTLQVGESHFMHVNHRSVVRMQEELGLRLATDQVLSVSDRGSNLGLIAALVLSTFGLILLAGAAVAIGRSRNEA